MGLCLRDRSKSVEGVFPLNRRQKFRPGNVFYFYLHI